MQHCLTELSMEPARKANVFSPRVRPLSKVAIPYERVVPEVANDSFSFSECKAGDRGCSGCGKPGHLQACPGCQSYSVFVGHIRSNRDLAAARTVTVVVSLHKGTRQDTFQCFRQANNLRLFVFHINHLLSF